MTFLAPPIRVKNPQFNQTQISYPDKDIFVNEEKEAVRILESLTDRILDEGAALLKEPYVQEKCSQKLHQYLTELCQKLGYDITTIVVCFF